MNSFEILEVSSNASMEEIKAAYKRLAREHHPDKGGDVEKFQLVQRAYEKLTVRGTKPVFSTIFDDLVNIVPRRQCRVEIKMTLEELFVGKRLSVEGIELEIPAGISPYQVFTVSELPTHQFLISLAKHPYFSLDIASKNLIFKTSISLCEALIGYRGKIKHPNGQMLYISTPPDTVITNDAVFRCKGIGLPFDNGQTLSDIIVVFNVIMPKRINSEMYRTQLMDIFECNVPLIVKKDEDVHVQLKI